MNGKLPAKTLALWRARATALFGLICGAFALFLRPFILIATAAYLIAVLWYIPRLHKSFNISLSENKVSLSYGAVFKRQKVLLLKEKAVVWSVSTPLCRIMRLESIAIRLPSGWFLLPETERGWWMQNV